MAFALAAGIGAGGSLLSSLIGSSASSSAAKEQEQGQMNALTFETQLLKNSEGALSPYVGSGGQALNTLNSLLSPGSQESTLESLPGFQFQSKWGTKAAENALSAQGLGGSTGPLAQGISNYNNGLASTYYGNYVSQLQAQANMGLGATESATGAATTVGGQGANALASSGNAAASGTLGSANALSGGLTSAAGSTSNALLLSQLLGNSSNSASGLGGLFSGTSGISSSAYNDISGDISGDFFS